MSWPLRLSASVLAVALASAGGAAFVARAQSHPNVEPSVAASCVGCHMSDYRGARHHVGEKPTTCGTCHAQEAWHSTHFDHPFALSGAHSQKKCFACHRGDPPVFHGTPNLCIGCHRAEYERAPHHVERFPTTCEECHSFVAWKPTLERDREHEKPPPLPTTSTPLPPPTATTSATATATATTTAKQKPKLKPTATATASTRPPTIPDVITHPSEHSE